MIDRQHSRYDVSGIIHNQLVRSATSIGANIVEGKASSSRREFKKYYEIALKSSNETKYWLKILLERDKTSIKDKKVINELLLEAIELSKMLGAGVRNLKNKNLVFKE
ncbi:four helix bundle protein [Candidatus Dojkabacteria bacterium]|uniref:Four helix bundle protein n=1 Tax=Candidatus Dojkabacteria bacterium TaxID=2099670 RepID=A0A955IAU7_9BACT|nr:four helix bundle protein [Candidatus Dojkabacteria bacterium]